MDLRPIMLVLIVLVLIPEIVLGANLDSWTTPSETAFGNKVKFHTTYADDSSQPIITDCYINIDNQNHDLIYDSDSEVYSWDSDALEVGTHSYITTCDSDSTSGSVIIHEENWCSESELRACDTQLQGICGWGYQTCLSNSWSNCQQNYSSRQEDCSNGLDDDCDGLVDDEDIGSCNDPPMFDPLNNISTVVGEHISFIVTAVDPEDHDFVLSVMKMPSGASFTQSTGMFSWTPQAENDKHSHKVSFQAEDEFGATSNTSVYISVGSVNNPPTFEPLSTLTVEEGIHISFSVTANDMNNDEITILSSILPDGMSQTGSLGGDGLQTNNYGWTPGFDQSGIHSITFSASDGIDNTQMTLDIVVADVNQVPSLEDIPQQSLKEEELFELTVIADDLDKDDNLTISASYLPPGAKFSDEQNRRGTFRWTPSFDQGGSYSVSFSVNDGRGGSDSTTASLIVGNANRPPILNDIGDRQVSEGEVLAFVVSGSDPDGKEVSFSASNLPAGASFDENTRFFHWEPGFEQTGQYKVIFRITDDEGASDSEEVIITVGDVNRAPILSSIGDKTVLEGDWLSFQVGATDPDGDPVIFDSSALPSGANFDYSTGFFSWQPDYTYSGPDQLYVSFFVMDVNNASDTETIVISIGDVNRRPRLDLIGNKQLLPDQTLLFTISGSDPDGDNVDFYANNLPEGASFIDRKFTWTPTETDVANHRVTFIVSDGELNDSEEVVITVGDINRPPQFATIGDRRLTVNERLTVTIQASDPENDNLSITASGLPSRAEFVDNGDGSASLLWKPRSTDTGNRIILFNVTDKDGEQDWERMLITVVAPGNVCSDGTRLNDCSDIKPKFCENGSLVDLASKCGCPPSLIQKDDICLLRPIPRNNSYIEVPVDFSNDMNNSDCIDNWRCSKWGECENGTQIRECFDGNFCDHPENSPAIARTCGCENGILDGDELGVDCGGSECEPCPIPEPRPVLVMSDDGMEIYPDKPFPIIVSNEGDFVAEGYTLDVDGEKFLVENINPGESINIMVELPPSSLLNNLNELKNLSIKMFSKEQIVVDSSNLIADINIPEQSVYFEQRNGVPTVIIVFDNSGREKRTGIEVELFLSKDGKIIYEDLFGPFKVEKNEIFVRDIKLVPDYLSSGKITVQAKFFEKGILINDSYSESEIKIDNVVPKRAILIIVTVIVLIVALYFSLMLMFRRMFPR